MRRFFLAFICISAISVAVFYIVSVPHERTDVRAARGVIDLRGADLPSHVYSLGGEWEFYWDRLYQPGDFAGSAREDEKTFVRVPASWSDAGYPRLGHATYRLTLTLPEIPEGKNFALYVPEIRSAAAVWVGGEKVYEAGRVGADKSGEIARPKNGILNLPHRGTVEIVVQVSSYGRFFGGIRNAFCAGPYSALTRWAVGRWASAAFLAGVFLVIGLYHLMLGLFQHPAERAYLVFAAHSATAGFRFFIEKNSIAQYLASDGQAAFINPASAFMLVLHTMLSVALALLVFEVRPGRAMRAFYAASAAVLLASQVFVPPPLRYWLEFFCIIPMLAAMTQSALALRGRPFREYPWLWLYYASFALTYIWSPFGNTRMEPYFFVPHVAPNVLIMLVQCAALSQDYSKARKKARELAARADFYRRMNHDLRTPLTKISTSVQMAAVCPENAPALLKKSQDEIMKIADMIGRALDEDVEGPS